MPFGKSIKTWLQMPTIGVVRRTMQQTHSTSTSTTATRTTTIRQILIVYVPFGILQQNIFSEIPPFPKGVRGISFNK
ncbi:MAG: hypothetical protein JXR68_11800 [Bacteroidales bacterium]|nr:hypothetical protein [Bacteroidales bacterium]